MDWWRKNLEAVKTPTTKARDDSSLTKAEGIEGKAEVRLRAWDWGGGEGGRFRASKNKGRGLPITWIPEMPGAQRGPRQGLPTTGTWKA